MNELKKSFYIELEHDMASQRGYMTQEMLEKFKKLRANVDQVARDVIQTLHAKNKDLESEFVFKQKHDMHGMISSFAFSSEYLHQGKFKTGPSEKSVQRSGSNIDS